jgi:transcription-repair coupling factor (superfamily II helicase)
MNHAIPEPLLALWLAEEAVRRGGVLVHVARSDARAARLLGPAQVFAGEAAEVLPLPGWDVLPYDPARPSASIVGQRIGTLLSLAGPCVRPRLVLTSADAVLQRVPLPQTWEGTVSALRVGDAFDPEALRHALAASGYRVDEEIHEPGEVALRGEVVDLWPAGDTLPVRLDVRDGRVAAMRRFDPVSQRSTGDLDAMRLLPAVEFPPDEEEAHHLLRAGDDAPLPELPARLVPLFDLMPGAAWVLDPEAEARWQAFAEQVEDAYAATSKARRVAASAGRGALPPPRRLYLTPDEAGQAVADSRIEAAIKGAPAEAPRSTAALVARLQKVARRVVLACPDDPGPIVRALGRRGIEARAAASWQETLACDLAALRIDVADGFEHPDLLLLPMAGLMRTARGARGASPALDVEEGPRVGDLVVHAEHGVARLRGLASVEGEERVMLEYAGGAELLVESWELRQVWRLGGDAAQMAPDHLGGEAWQRTRAELETELTLAAERLTQLAEARTRETAPRIEAGPAYARLAHRFAYAPSRDQQAAFDAVLADLASGRPMNRLVCGDVGFGKTEVALRAAAAAALAGWQVAIAAPTTVLARQHLDGFRRRFAGTDIRVEGLIRGTPSEAREVRKGLADGSIGIVVGTQALAADGIRFKRLGLVVVDEEQRFGEAVKERLASVGGRGVHLLTMTATPIPRTLQQALVGLRDCSVIATAPVRRQPTRTFALPWDPVVAREALLREKCRGGQSFVVVPRIEALRRVEEELRELVPELELRVAHGRLAPEALDDAVGGFARGEGDVMLATDIIEAGLDIPRANLILVREAERFGLAQLHQLRGRVGRGARRGAAYFTTAPERRLAPATQARLRTLEALTDLGAGAALSAADLDLRGGGDLFGTEQAGHLRRVGTEMYQDLLAQALAVRRGIARPPPPARVRGMPPGRFPEPWIPEENLRLALLRRLARAGDPAALDEFGAELADRFGDLPPEAAAMLLQARLRLLAGAHGIGTVDIGPKASALTFLQGYDSSRTRLTASLPMQIRDGRAIARIKEAELAHILQKSITISS